MADKTVPVLPPIGSTSDASNAGGTQTPPIDGPLIGPSSKDTMIGIGALVILAIVFFFVRMAFVNYLVGPSMKRSPNNAGMAGWALFGGLFFGGALGCVALISTTYMTMPLILSLSVLALICLVIAIVVAAKK
jgi:hypothetical protein